MELEFGIFKELREYADTVRKTPPLIIVSLGEMMSGVAMVWGPRVRTNGLWFPLRE